MGLDYEIRIKDWGPREAVLTAVKGTLDTMDAPFQIDEIRDEGDELVVDMDIDVEQLILWAFRTHPRGRFFVPFIRVLRKAKRARSGGKFKADDPKTPENEAWETPPKKKAASRKRAAPKKVVEKERAPTKRKRASTKK
jgi:hypothetical protein